MSDSEFYAEEQYSEDGQSRVYSRAVFVAHPHWLDGYQRIWYLDVPDGCYVLDTQEFEYTVKEHDKLHLYQHHVIEPLLNETECWVLDAIAINDGPRMQVHRNGSFLYDFGPAGPKDERADAIADLRVLFSKGGSQS